MIPLVPAALAYAPPSGLHLPQWGGPLASVAEPGAPGLVANPAAAADGSEVMLDVGLVFSSLKIVLEDGEPSGRPGLSLPIPHLAGTVGLGERFGLGARIDAPYVRIGGSDPDGPLRYYSIEGEMIFLEHGVALAWRSSSRFALGGELRLLQGRYDGYKAYDLGVTITEMLGTDYGVPLQEPYLEGTIAYDGLRGPGVGASVGVSISPERGPSYHLAWRSGSTVRLRGDLELVPAETFEVVITGGLESVIHLPQELWLASRIPLGELALELEAGWIDYSANSTLDTTAEDLTLSATDSGLGGLLAAYGLNEQGLIAAVSEQHFENGWRDVYSLGGAFIAPLGAGLEVRAGAWLASAAVPTAHVTPGNLDFASLDLRTVLVWERGRATIYASADYYAGPTRRVEDSVYSIYNDPDAGYAGLPGDGLYSLTLFRGGLGGSWSF